MTKRQFLSSLRKEIKIFNDDKQEEILTLYKAKLKEKMDSGVSEEEAVESMGKMEDIVSEILTKEAHKTKTKKKPAETSIDKFVRILTEETKDFINQLGKLFQVKSTDDIIHLIIQILLILICIWILRIPFYIFKEIGLGVFELFPNLFSGIFSLLWNLLIQVAYFFVSLYLVYVIVKRVILKDHSEVETIEKDKKELKKEVKKVVKTVDNSNDITNSILQVILFIITIPIYFALFGLFVALGIVIQFLVDGVSMLGVLFVILGIIFIFIAALALINHIIFGGSKK